MERADSMMKKLDSSKIMRDEETKKSFGEYKSAYEKVRPNLLAIAGLIGEVKDFSKKCSPSYFGYSGKPAEEVKKLYAEKMSDCYKLLDNVAKSEQKEVQDILSRRANISLLESKKILISTKLFMILTLTSTATSLLSTAESMAIPCSVNTYGIYLLPP